MTYPSSTELCNGEDDDCDGEIDEEVLQVYYIDEDGDGYGHPNEEVQTEAVIPSGFPEFSRIVMTLRIRSPWQ